MKRYQAVFFDWDGTAVCNRESSVDEVAKVMGQLLDQKIYLFVISGTTYDKIAHGTLDSYFSKEQLKYLYFGLGRGAINYGFDEQGKRYSLFAAEFPTDLTIKIHDVAYQIHRRLRKEYGYDTDIVFTRPGYCKIDLLPEVNRESELYLRESELITLKKKLHRCGLDNEVRDLIQLAIETGKQFLLNIKPTCDAKYLEVGLYNKSDNVDCFIDTVLREKQISIKNCCFFGDEFLTLCEGITGSDSYMITEASKEADFFDVSEHDGERPERVISYGKGVKGFYQFLSALVKEGEKYDK